MQTGGKMKPVGKVKTAGKLIAVEVQRKALLMPGIGMKIEGRIGMQAIVV